MSTVVEAPALDGALLIGIGELASHVVCGPVAAEEHVDEVAHVDDLDAATVFHDLDTCQLLSFVHHETILTGSQRICTVF